MVREILNPMVREMRYYNPAAGHSSFETPLRHKDTRPVFRSCFDLSGLSQGDRQPEARADDGSYFDAHHSAIRPMTLSRVVTAVWFEMLRAKEEYDHWDRLWLALTDYEKAVKQSAEPKLLGGQ
jgi:hypothetical protein